MSSNEPKKATLVFILFCDLNKDLSFGRQPSRAESFHQQIRAKMRASFLAEIWSADVSNEITFSTFKKRLVLRCV